MSAPATTYQRAQGNGPMGNHPQLRKVIDAILQGESCNSISKWVSPRVTRFTIGKLAEQVRAQREMAAILAKAKQLQGAIDSVAETQQSVDKLTRGAVLGSRHIERVEQLLGPLERQVAEAEADGDRQGLSSVAKTALTAIRMQAELDGTLAQVAAQFAAPAVQNNLQVVILPGSMPTETLEAPALEATSTPLPDAD